MRTADRRHPVALAVQASLIGLAGMLGLCGMTQAQTPAAAPTTPPPEGPPPMVRYTPLAADGPLLYPRAPGRDAEPGAVLRAEAEGRQGLAWSANAAVGRLLVEVDRDAVPADGQSGVKLKVQIQDRHERSFQRRWQVFIDEHRSADRDRDSDDQRNGRNHKRAPEHRCDSECGRVIVGSPVVGCEERQPGGAQRWDCLDDQEDRDQAHDHERRHCRARCDPTVDPVGRWAT